MIDVIIPCFNAHKTLDNTLQSIIKQSIKDKVKVLLVDDCSEESYDSFVDKYKKDLDISLLRLEENVGPGIAREKGIENTNGDYFTFIDSDDTFYDSKSLEYLYEKIEEGYDLVNSVEYDEKRKALMILNGNVHGALYRRKYVEDNDIHFNATRIHEDNYFNNYVVLSGARVFKIKKCTYFYTYNENSITNKDSDDAMQKLEIYFQNMKELLDIAHERNYRKVRIAKFISEKYRYFKRILKEFSDEEKKQFINMVNEYDPDFMEYIDLDDVEFLKLLLQNLLNYLDE